VIHKIPDISGNALLDHNVDRNEDAKFAFLVALRKTSTLQLYITMLDYRLTIEI